MDNFEHAINHLQADSIRITPQRRAIIRYLAEAAGHPTAEEIYEALIEEYPNMSMATIYNTINLLLDYDLVKHVRSEDASAHYDFNAEEHYHILCKRCGKIEDVFYPVFNDVEEKLEALTGYKINKYHLEIEGLCKECQEKIKAKDNLQSISQS